VNTAASVSVLYSQFSSLGDGTIAMFVEGYLGDLEVQQCSFVNFQSGLSWSSKSESATLSITHTQFRNVSLYCVTYSNSGSVTLSSIDSTSSCLFSVDGTNAADQQISITNSTFSGSSLLVQNWEQATVDSLTISASSSSGLSLNNVVQASVSNSQFSGSIPSTDGGMILTSNCGGVTITGCSFTNQPGGSAVKVDNSNPTNDNQAHISSCTFSDCNGSGIYLNYAVLNIDNLQFENTPTAIDCFLSTVVFSTQDTLEIDGSSSYKTIHNGIGSDCEIDGGPSNIILWAAIGAIVVIIVIGVCLTVGIVVLVKRKRQNKNAYATIQEYE
jgi:uncharacterized protein YjbI with pentapeptide repeats